jgi:hypothetical protein
MNREDLIQRFVHVGARSCEIVAALPSDSTATHIGRQLMSIVVASIRTVEARLKGR